MSFGQKKMRAKADELAPNVLACEHRGQEWIVITDAGFYFGKESPDGPIYETFKPMLAQVDDNFKPWAKKLLKDFNNLRAQKEAQNERKAA